MSHHIEQAIAALHAADEDLNAQIRELQARKDEIVVALGALTGPASHAPTPAAKKEAPKPKPAKKKTAPKIFACSQAGCDRRFSRQQGLTRHLNETHGIRPGDKTTPAAATPPAAPVTEPTPDELEPEEAPSTNHRCDECGSQFDSRTWLLGHRRKTGHDIDGDNRSDDDPPQYASEQARL